MSTKSKGWDPERKRYVPISPYSVTPGHPTHRIVPRMPEGMRLDPPTEAEAEAYEIKRARILATQCRECGTAFDPRTLQLAKEHPLEGGYLGACCVGDPAPEPSYRP